ncbi:hypothetical protein GWI33_015061 [Rhynchophorus ferrugineus]|uniref:Uncharacterized protein n=1 Tax=Rhynchophorus ferrugineus TaxID=354439 RepID=A0A834M8G1_RHYFE|nr:hypothetical protein GWI33_015061 [Rhynchophorus ferrugineus]
MNKAPVIGIDLGTSFSAAAVLSNGKLETIANLEGYRTTPSFIFYNEENSNISVGTTADDQSIRCITNFFYDVKRFIGRDYNDVYVQLIKNDENYRFNLTNNGDDVVFKFKHNGKLMTKTPEEVSSEVLKYLKNSASEYLGAEVKEAVVSVPAYFCNAQKKATRKAAELAGLKVLKLITEPVAGALHYFRANPKIKGKILIYDFGGGTFDVSVIEVKGKDFNVLNVEGNSFLGGRDMDNLLIDYFKKILKNKYGQQIITPRLIRRLQKQCVLLKEKLSIHDEYWVVLENINGSEENFELSITRKQYEEIIHQLVAMSMDSVKKCLRDLNITPEDITNVMLVGGVTRTPLIRSTVAQYFGASKIKTDVNPDETVALGAAYQAALLIKQCTKKENIRVTEVTPLSLGIETRRGLMSRIIEKGSKLPLIRDRIFSTIGNDQSSITFRIYEGERSQTIYNNYLGQFTCDDLPKGKAGDVSVAVIFILDCDGILRVEVKVLSTGRKTKFSVTLQEYRLCENEIKCKVEDAEKNRHDDDVFESYVNIYSSVKRVINHIMYGLENIPSIIEKEYVKRKCSELDEYIEQTNSNSSFDEILEKFQAFHKVIKGIVDDIDVDFEEALETITDVIEEYE